MKTCAFCGLENEDNLSCCYECGMELTASEPVAEAVAVDDSGRPLAIVGIFGDSLEASMLRARLEQAGIEACVPEELDPSPFGNFQPLARVTVRVAEKDLEAAREFLAAAA